MGFSSGNGLIISSSFLILLWLYLSIAETEAAAMGVCYGELGNNLPTPKQSIKLAMKLGAGRIKIYGANPQILTAVQNTNLEISIMVPNDLIPAISTNQNLADQWVQSHVVPFHPKSKIRHILVGNEILSNQPASTWFMLVPAMLKISHSVQKFGLKGIKIGTPLAMDALESSFPPSAGTFRSDVRDKVIKPLLQFLDQTKSFFFVDVYPYFAWASQPSQINLQYALLESKNITYTDPGSGLRYTNILDQMLDAIIFAMKQLGYPNVPLFIAETGWPSRGDAGQLGADIRNAATYNRNVIKKFTARSPIGTPARPAVAIPATIFALYNENEKPGPGTERNFGLLYPNGSHVYPIRLS